MRAPTRAREISFTFTPRRVCRPLRSESAAPTLKDHVVCARVRRLHCAASLRGGGDSLAQTLTPAPEPMPFAAAANHAASLAPQSPFPLATPPLVGKETTLSKSCGSAGARAEGNGGGERAVHIGTTKG